MFASRSKGIIKKPEFGRVYVFRITLSCGKIIWKIGSGDDLITVLNILIKTLGYLPTNQIVACIDMRVPTLVVKHIEELLSEFLYKP